VKQVIKPTAIRCVNAWGWAAVWLAAVLSSRSESLPTEPPALDVILTNVLKRVNPDPTLKLRSQFEYTRKKITEELDDEGTVTEREEKVHRLIPIHGRSFARLLTVDGHPLEGKELKREEEREQAARADKATSKPKAPAAKRETLTPELLNRYEFKITGQGKVHGRAVWIITFKPKTRPPPENSINDRVANRLAGTVWVDMKEYEVAKLDAHLTGEVSLVGGLIGNLRKFSFKMERQRVGEGEWLPTLTNFEYEGRQLVITKHSRYREESSDFKRVVEKAPQPGPTIDQP
jgi:hypothetical protein